MSLESIIKKLTKKDINGNLYIIKSEIDNLNLNQNDNIRLISILNSSNVKIKALSGNESVISGDWKSSNISPLTSEEEYQKFCLYKETKEPKLKETLILSNMGLVQYVAWTYSNFYGIDINEVLSYGYEGLIVAVERYNVDIGIRFSTFAINYIKGYCKTGIQIILTGSKNDFSCAYIKAKKRIEQEEGKILSEDMDLIKQVADILFRIKELNFSSFELLKKKLNFLNPLSIDNVLISFEDFEEEIIEMIEKEKLREYIEKVLKELSHREEAIIRLRFGFLDGKVYTLKEVSEKLSICKECVRKTQIKVLKKLENIIKVNLLETFNQYDFDISKSR